MSVIPGNGYAGGNVARPPVAAIALDMDGTLVDSHGRIHPADVEILRSAQRVVFMPATGRALPSVRSTFAKNGLFAGGPLPFPLVLHNGAALYGPGETLRRYRPLPPAIQTILLNTALAHPDITTFVYHMEDLFMLWPSPYADRMAARFDLEPRPFSEVGPTPRISKIMCISADEAALQELVADLAGLPVVPAFSLPTVLEINLAGINKGDGALALLEDLGWDNVPLVAAGDGENDLDLFDRAGLVFVPSSSPEAIRARAHHVIDITHTGLLAPILRQVT